MIRCEGTNHCQRESDFRCVDCGRELCARHGDLWTACGVEGRFMHRRSRSDQRRRTPVGGNFVTASTIYGIKRGEQSRKRAMYAALRVAERAAATSK